MALPQAVAAPSKKVFYVITRPRGPLAHPYLTSCFAFTQDVRDAGQFKTAADALNAVARSKHLSQDTLSLVRVEETTTQAGETRRLLAETESAPTFGTQDVVKYVLYYTDNHKRFAVADGTQGGYPVLTWPMDGNLNRALLFDTQGHALEALQENALGREAEVLGDRGGLARVLVSPAKPVVTLTETVLS